MAIKHVKVATVPDDGISEVGTDEWNDDHSIDNGTITNDHLEGNIAQSKITNLTTDISSKAPLNSPVLVTPNIGTPSAGTLTNCTGLPATTGLTATGTKSSSTYLRGDDTWSQISGIPSGVILMWSGSLASIPAGWNLCDGSNGTPNLIAKFVRSIATSSTEAGSTGGADSVTLTGAQSGTSAHGHGGSTSTTGSHTHTGSTSTAGDHGHTGSTNTTGAHTHSITEGNNYSGYDGVDNRFTDRSPASGNQTYMYTGSNGNHSHTVTINNAGDHSHSMSLDATGNHSHSVTVNNSSQANASSSHENRPAYYELAYIMKA